MKKNNILSCFARSPKNRIESKRKRNPTMKPRKREREREREQILTQYEHHVKKEFLHCSTTYQYREKDIIKEKCSAREREEREREREREI